MLCYVDYILCIYHDVGSVLQCLHMSFPLKGGGYQHVCASGHAEDKKSQRSKSVFLTYVNTMLVHGIQRNSLQLSHHNLELSLWP